LRQRFARSDKRAKLPRWINQYISESASNLSTDIALTFSKQFMREISQNLTEDQTGISLWTLEDIQKAQEKQKDAALAAAEEAEAEMARREDAAMDVDDFDEYGDGGISDTALVDLDV
jgi:DNA excision repair protein ERCC-2